MKQSRRRIHHAVVVEDSVLGAAEAAVATTIRATHASRGNPAGSGAPGIKLPLSELHQNAKRQPLLPKLTIGDWVCQDEVDQALLNARKNTRASKNSATRPSAASSAKTNHQERRAFRANWIWTNYKGTLPSKLHCFKWETTTATFRASPANVFRKRQSRRTQLGKSIYQISVIKEKRARL